MGSSDQFNIRWNNYTSVLQNVFRKLLEGEQFVDVTLACEGQSIKCHRLILSACSAYFDRILSDNPTSNLVIYLKDMKFWELRALVTFMYNGEVSISQQKLPHLCKAAEALKVKGLAHDTSLAEGDMDKINDDEMDEFVVDGKPEGLVQRENRRSPNQGHQKSLLRQHNNLSAFAAAAAAANRQPQQIKRKILTQPPKLVKMQRVERPSNGVGGNNGNMKPQLVHTGSNMVPVKKSDPEANRSASFSKEKETYEEDDDDAFPPDGNADTNIKEEQGDNADEAENGDMEGCDENDANSIVSDGEDEQNGQAGRTNKVAFKYGKEVRDSALTALQSGMTLRQCSETYGIPKKTLSKWKTREARADGDEEPASPNRPFRAKEDGPSPTGPTGIVLPPKTTMGAPIDSADRAERLKKATELAMSGVTVRQAAAHYEIPRTTLCAYMKRRGLAAKRNFLPNNGGGANNSVKRMAVKVDSTGEANGQVQAGNSSHYEDFPFLGISELMNEMGEGNYEGDGYVDGEEEYSEK
ncbi:Protein bric-a-brac 2 [Orchesella cincta]|uniref:Protein bric-a-brac 2 n=1 Tax=Orchesella cincta TaxID=48709 RepID=A0A1D2MHB0_ORCCI|nr:Protein bric-a-brac 2 [Orchesella cincta]